MKATHILLWSGGFDSTAILLDMVSNPDKYPSVRVVSCGLTMANNYAEDKAARAKISELLNLTLKPTIEWFDTDALAFTVNGGIQSSVWAWLSGMNVTCEDDGVNLCYGFIRGDDFWHYRHKFEQAVKNIAAITMDDPGVSIKFSYPLEWKYKKEIVASYLNHPEVFRAISWGGDTVAAKLKEKEELEFLFETLLTASRDAAFKATENLAKQQREAVIISSLEREVAGLAKQQSDSAIISTQENEATPNEC